jgi:hypothetical protein
MLRSIFAAERGTSSSQDAIFSSRDLIIIEARVDATSEGV